MKLPAVLSTSSGILRVASVAMLVSLALMAWGILDPRPLPVIVAMSVGQGIGILGAALFLLVVARDLRRSLAERKVEAPADPPE
jgi:hypothetical protein